MSVPVITLSSSAAKTINISSHPNSEFNSCKFEFPSNNVDETEETFVLKLANNAQSSSHDHSCLIFPAGKNNQQAKDSEIGVFDADKYFNQGFNFNLNQSPKLVRKSLPPPHRPNKRSEIKEKTRVATPSVVSESSSNNSRSVVLLLRDVPRTSKPRKTIKKSFLAVIAGCNNPLCCHRSSVDTSDQPSKKISTTVDSILVKGIPTRQLDHRRSLEIRRSSSDSDFGCRQKFDEHGLRVNSNDHFTFPIFSTGDNIQTTKETVMPKQRSLQVFGSPIVGNGNKCHSPEKIDPTWDALIPKPIRITSNENDSDSDASSDLFEIESFSKNNPFLSRQASDNDGTTCYAPSEASIEWSVVTASAPDLSELKSTSISIKEKDDLSSKIDERLSINRRRSSILSGCKSQKAVRTVEDVHKVNNYSNDKGFSRRFHGAESYAQMTARLYDEAGFVARNRPAKIV